MESELTAKLYASVVIRSGDQVLVVIEKDDAGQLKHNLPGGGVELGETPIEAAARECQEEVGLDVAPSAFLHVVVNTWSKKHTMLIYFEASIDNDTPLKLETGMEAKWMTEVEIEDIPSDSFVFGSLSAIKKSFSGYRSQNDSLLIRKNGAVMDWSHS